MSNLEEVTVTTLDPERFRTLLAPEALAAFEHTTHARSRAAAVADVLERQLDRSRRRRRRDAALADRLCARRRDRCALAGHRRRPRVLRDHQAPAQPAARTRRRRRPAGRRRARRLRALLRGERRADRRARSPDGRRAAARPADGGHDPAPARDGGAGDLALARRCRPAQRARARSLAVPDALRRAARRRTCSRSPPTSGRGSTDEADGDRPLDRRVLAEEPPMAFTSVTAVLRAAGLAADHHHHARAVFERLDGSVGWSSIRPSCSRSSSCGSTSRCSRRSRAGTASRTRSACSRRSPSTSPGRGVRTSCWPAPT